MKPSLLILALSFATLCLFIAANCSQKSTNDNSSVATANTANSATSKPKTNRPAPDFTVSAPDLLKEATADRQKAEVKYTGKQIAVSGRVVNVFADKTPMQVALAAEMEFVIGKFDEEEKESVAALKDNQNVTMQCLGGDRWSLSMPSLIHCAIVKVE
jgi:hypothetical protein